MESNLDRLRKEYTGNTYLSQRLVIQLTVEAIKKDFEAKRCESKDCCDRNNCNNSLIRLDTVKKLLEERK